MLNDVYYLQETPSFVNAVNVGLVTFIIQHNRIQGVFLLCKITNLLIYSIKIKCVVRIQIKIKGGYNNE